MASAIATSVLLIPCFVVGCDMADYNTMVLAHLQARAAFDLRCASPRVHVVPLQRDENVASGEGLVRVAGAHGCHRRATYVLVDGAHGAPPVWLMNTGSEGSSAAAANAAP